MGQLFVVTGPSGAGKREVLARVEKMGFEFCPVKSYTTRVTDSKELKKEDKLYERVSEDEFDKMVANDDFLEWAEVHNHKYGSKKDEVETALRKNERVVMEVDPVGARKIKKEMPNAITIFIMPPSYENLKARLRTLSQDEVDTRIRIGKKELEKLLDWDFIIIYEDGKLDQAASDLVRNIKGAL